MRFEGRRGFAPVAMVASILMVFGCGDEAGQLTPPGARFAGGPDPSCDFKDATKALKDYFPGNGKGSIEDQALDILSLAQAECEVPNPTGYATRFYSMAGFIELHLQMGTALGDPADGALLVWELMNVESPAGGLIFDPCDGAADCWTWDPDLSATEIQEEIVAALSDADYGAWGVVSGGGMEAVCSGYRSGTGAYECDDIDPSLTGDVWGANPMVDWDGTLSSRESLLFGSPIPLSEVSIAEALLDTDVPAYKFFLIPHPLEFPMDNEMIVGLCSTASPPLDTSGDPTIPTVVQRDKTALESAFLDWCDNQIPFPPGQQAVGGSLLRRLAGLAWELFDFTPRPLWATASVFLGSPGGAGGAFSDFFAITPNATGVLEFVDPPGPPVDGVVGLPQTITILARTDRFTPLEQVALEVSVRDQNGLLPSGGSLEGDDCVEGGNSCTGNTQGDEEGAEAGTRSFEITVNKTGVYRFCVTGTLDPFSFEELCSGPVNYRPHD